jgi:hypothetical protein
MSEPAPSPVSIPAIVSDAALVFRPPPSTTIAVIRHDEPGRLYLGEKSAICIHLDTGEVTVTGEADLSEAARDFWTACRLIAGRLSRTGQRAIRSRSPARGPLPGGPK